MLSLLSSKERDQLAQILSEMRQLAHGLQTLESGVGDDLKTLVTRLDGDGESVLAHAQGFDQRLKALETRLETLCAEASMASQVQVVDASVVTGFEQVGTGIERLHRDVGVIGERQTATLWQMKGELEAVLARIERDLTIVAQRQAEASGNAASEALSADISTIGERQLQTLWAVKSEIDARLDRIERDQGIVGERQTATTWQVKSELETVLGRVERDLGIIAQRQVDAASNGVASEALIGDLRDMGERQLQTLWTVKAEIDTRLERLERDLGIVGERTTNTLWQVKSELDIALERVVTILAGRSGSAIDALGVIASAPGMGIASNLAHVLETAREARAPVHRVQLAHPFSNVTRQAWADGIQLWLRFALDLLGQCEGRACPSCTEAATTFLFTSYDGYPFVECNACRTWYVPLSVNETLFERYFEVCPEARRFADYMLSQDQNESVVEHDRRRFDAYYSQLRAMAPAAQSMLDIGCSVGTSLAIAAKHGFKPVGVEVNEAARAAAKAKKRRVYATLADLPDETFDVITLWESLEHIDAVDSVFSFVTERLAVDGLLAVTVPNLDSPILRSLRSDSFHINGGAAFAGHINLFDRRTISLLFNRFGLEVVEAKGQYSMNLMELAGYHLGAWRGARDYLERDDVEIALPATAVEVLNAIGPIVAKWEGDFAMAPILKVIARRRAS